MQTGTVFPTSISTRALCGAEQMMKMHTDPDVPLRSIGSRMKTSGEIDSVEYKAVVFKRL